MHSLSFLPFSSYYHQKDKNLTKCNILNTLAFTKYGKLAKHSLKNLFPWSIVLGLDDSCSWPQEGLSKLWSLAMASNVESSTPPLLSTVSTIALGRMAPACQIGSKTLFWFLSQPCLLSLGFGASINGSSARL